MPDAVGVTFSGGERLAATFRELAQVVPAKVLRPAVSKAMAPIRKAISNRVPSKYQSVKRTVGSSVPKAKTGKQGGKAGFGVGRQTAAKKRAAEARNLKRKSKAKPGVGIGSRNVHWLVLGTGARSTRSGYGRGRIDATKLGLNTVVRNAVRSVEPEALAILVAEVQARMEREVARLKR